jgi:hypothetical protein
VARSLYVERGAATARTGDVGVAKLEAGAHCSLDVVDLRAVQVLVTQRIDVQLNAARFELLIELGGIFLEVQIVLEPRAAAPNYPQSKSLTDEAFALGNLTNFLCGDLGNGNHGELVRQYATGNLVVKARASNLRTSEGIVGLQGLTRCVTAE